MHNQPKARCPKCGLPASFIFDDFEVNMKRFMHLDGSSCWVRIANKEPKIPPEHPARENWKWSK